MTDIIERLRDAASNINDEWDLHGDLKEAADEIERLRRALVSLLEMPSACAGDEIIENNRRREVAREAVASTQEKPAPLTDIVERLRAERG